MHPPLFKPHPLCEECVQDLVKCHAENPAMKFFGACNDAKTAMDKCFREEKVRRRTMNFEKAKAERDAWKQRATEK